MQRKIIKRSAACAKTSYCFNVLTLKQYEGGDEFPERTKGGAQHKEVRRL